MSRSRHARAAVFLSATAAALAAGAACTSFRTDDPAVAPDASADGGDSPPPDGAAPDAAPEVTCDPRLPFERIEPLTSVDPTKSMPINTPSGQERGGTLSSDERTLYFHREGADALASTIYVATRAMASGPFTTVLPISLKENGMHFDANPQLSSDGTTLFFDSDRSTKTGQFTHTLFSAVVTAGPTAEPHDLRLPAPAAEPFVRGSELFYTRTPSAGSYTIVVTNDTGTAASASLPDTVNAGIDRPSTHPVLSADGLDLYFARRPSGTVSYRIFRASRPAVGQPFGSATQLADVKTQELALNGPENFAQSPLWISFTSPVRSADFFTGSSASVAFATPFRASVQTCSFGPWLHSGSVRVCVRGVNTRPPPRKIAWSDGRFRRSTSFFGGRAGSGNDSSDTRLRRAPRRASSLPLAASSGGRWVSKLTSRVAAYAAACSRWPI